MVLGNSDFNRSEIFDRYGMRIDAEFLILGFNLRNWQKYIEDKTHPRQESFQTISDSGMQ